MNLIAETEAILVRPLTGEDAEKTDDQAIRSASARRGGKAGAFAVVVKATSALSGYVAVEEEALSFYIIEKERDKGYAAAALTLCFDLLFGCAGVTKLTACCAEDNLYGIKTVQSAGMEKEKAEDGCFYAVLTAAAWERL